MFTFFLTSCVIDEEVQSLEFSDMEMVLKGKYDGEAFIKNKTYAYNDGSRVKFSAFNFFVSDLTATVSADESFRLDEVEYVDLAIFEGQEAADSGYKLNVGRAPVGDYRGFSFGVGVNVELNKTSPDEYGINHPLGDESHYDENLDGYKFLEIVGEVDYNSDNTYDASFNFVVGFDQNLEMISSTQSIEILPEITNQIEIEVDLRKILDNGIRTIDFSTQLSTSANPSDEIMLLLNSNIESAITVN